MELIWVVLPLQGARKRQKEYCEGGNLWSLFWYLPEYLKWEKEVFYLLLKFNGKKLQAAQDQAKGS